MKKSKQTGVAYSVVAWESAVRRKSGSGWDRIIDQEVAKGNIPPKC